MAGDVRTQPVADGEWRIEADRTDAQVGSSFDDIRLIGSFEIVSAGSASEPTVAFANRVTVA